MENIQKNNEDFSIFVESLHEALPEFIVGLERATPHQLSAQRNFFSKEFQLLTMLSDYFPENSEEKKACANAAVKWSNIDQALARTPLDLGNIKKEVDQLQNQLDELIDLTGGSSWMNL